MPEESIENNNLELFWVYSYQEYQVYSYSSSFELQYFQQIQDSSYFP